jgi:hypothetical protein
MAHQGPIPDSYWVEPDWLAAGEYPRNKDDASSRVKLRTILEAGITFFLDLTEPDEYGLKPYAHLLQEEAAELDRVVQYRRLSIPDLGTPDAATMTRLLDQLEAAMDQGHVVYVHCYGGIGRTGTVVGCHMVRHGMTGAAALHQIASLRVGTPDGWKTSPETDAQRQMVREWRAGQ